jgi:hypothetical protein
MARPKRLLLIGGLIVIPIVIAVLAIIVFFPTERVGAIAAERASVALDRQVGVERVRLKLWPRPAVALEGVDIAGASTLLTAEDAGRGSTPALAAIARVELRPRLLPLLRRSVEVHTVVVDRPVLSIRPAPGEDEAPEAEDPAFWDETTFNIREFLVRDGTIEYYDSVAGSTVRLEGVDQRLRLEGEMRGGRLARLLLDGEITVENLAADVPEALGFPVRDLRIGLEHRAVLDLTSEQATVDHLALRVQEFTVAGSGSVTAWSDPAARRVSLRFESGDADLADLVASLPDALRRWPANVPDGEQLSAAGGRLSLRATADGRFGDGEMPVVNGRVTLDDVALARGGNPLVTDVRGELAFSLDSVATEGITARLLDKPARFAFALHDPAIPRVNGTVEGTIDLERAMAIGLFPEGWAASGHVPIDMTVSGPLLEPTNLRLDGSVGVAGVRVEGVDWPAPLALIAGEITLTDQEVIGRGLNATLGDSDFTLEIAAADWLPYALGDSLTEPRVAFEARSRLVDFDALLPTDPAVPTYAEMFFARLAGKPVNGMSATEAAIDAGYTLPELPGIVLDGRIRADRVTQRNGDYRDVDLRIAGRDGQLDLRDVSLRTLGGAVQLAARLGSGDAAAGAPRSAPLEVSFQVDEVEADAFLHRFTIFRDNVEGSLLLAGAMALRLDEHLLPDPSSLSANGSIGVLDGQLANWSVVRRFGDQLGIARFDSLAFRDWSGSFSMLGSRIVLSESSLEGDDLVVNAAGWFDVGGQLDLGATAYLGSGVTSRVQGGPAATLLAAAGGADGSIPVGLRITGTRADPTVRLDLSEAGGRVAERVREEAEAEARELARTLAERAADRVMGTDSTGARATPGGGVEGALQRTQDAVVERLRGLLGAPAPAPDEPAAMPDTVVVEADSVPRNSAVAE